MNKRTLLALLLFVLLKAAPSFAARPMMTDDARIIESKACQLETWYKDTKQVKEFWALSLIHI